MLISLTVAAIVILSTNCISENGKLVRWGSGLQSSIDSSNRNSHRFILASMSDPSMNVRSNGLFIGSDSSSLQCFVSYRYSKNDIRDCFCQEFYQKNNCKSNDYNGEGTSYRPKNHKWDNVCAACCCLSSFQEKGGNIPTPTPESSFSPIPSPKGDSGFMSNLTSIPRPENKTEPDSSNNVPKSNYIREENNNRNRKGDSDVGENYGGNKNVSDADSARIPTSISYPTLSPSSNGRRGSKNKQRKTDRPTLNPGINDESVIDQQRDEEHQSSDDQAKNHDDDDDDVVDDDDSDDDDRYKNNDDEKSYTGGNEVTRIINLNHTRTPMPSLPFPSLSPSPTILYSKDTHLQAYNISLPSLKLTFSFNRKPKISIHDTEIFMELKHILSSKEFLALLQSSNDTSYLNMVKSVSVSITSSIGTTFSSEESRQNHSDAPRWTAIIAAILSCISLLLVFMAAGYLFIKVKKRERERKDSLWREDGAKHAKQATAANRHGGGTMYL